MRTAQAYTEQLQQLLPRGAVWTRDPDSVLTAVLAALAVEFARLDARAEQLLVELDPAQTYELLGDWERVLGLPDGCTPVTGTISERRAAVLQKLTSLGGQTPAFYIAMAAHLGVEVEIFEFDPDVDDYAPGLDISDGRWRYVWRMNVLTETDFTVFRAGVSAAGDRLVEGGALDLECVIRRAKPAHTQVVFSYPEA
ncbi:YmfQ family protein [Brevundimonas vitis]|uniref:YmfQ family protein n=1 Tax=Brevundimonas vitisensis TaxID=2800818 RepID=A0ABX7BPZ8_9CAUL|nr:YmfQ family protein [Brevundimonas vitisensis]QQQ19662.1 YmfQ family protein [Brevundimonas vitisensis]